MEEWKSVAGHEERYQVSSEGRVKSIKDNWNNCRDKILKPYTKGSGYLGVILFKEGKQKHFRVHRHVPTAHNNSETD